MKNIDFLLKMIGQLPETEQTDLYLLMQDKLRRRIPFPEPGQRPGATPGRYYTYTSPPAATPPHAT